jgi:2-polyprenyl-6-methoxyphenol hydroxylase-like FAD-dependent oxidoreductase
MTDHPRLPPTGIKIVIVGAGFAGLTAAIECDRKGHTVLLLDKSPVLAPLGDIISFGQNSSRIFDHWPGVRAALDPLIHKTDEFHFHDKNGRFVTTQSFAEEHKLWGQRVNGHRGEIHGAVLQHARERGVEIRLGVNVVRYFEDDDQAGVETDAGEVLTADVVLSAEGVRSRGRKLVLGYEDKPVSSGYAVFRTWFDAGALRESEVTRHLVDGGDSHNGWIGEDVHFLAAAVKGGREMSWVCTHKDEGGIEESWQFPGRVDDVLKVVEGWYVLFRTVSLFSPRFLLRASIC